MKTRKQAYTDYIVNGYGLIDKGLYNFCKMPRTKKKRIKRLIERTCYYDRKRKRVTFFNPCMLSTPMPKGILDMFTSYIPYNEGTAVRFRRYIA